MKKEIVIDRAKWRTGGEGENATGKGDTMLCNPSRFKCCLGFITIANNVKCGSAAYPSDTYEVIDGLTTKDDDDNCFDDTVLSLNATKINDDPYLTLAEKEKRLKELFKDSPYKLKFIGKPVKFEE